MLADNLKRYRAKIDLSQDRLVRKAGITCSTLSELESGVNRNPKVKTLQQLAKDLDVTLDDLMMGPIIFSGHQERSYRESRTTISCCKINFSGTFSPRIWDRRQSTACVAISWIG
jgi:transcriptional regulator with XRE-family HTH domain